MELLMYAAAPVAAAACVVPQMRDVFQAVLGWQQFFRACSRARKAPACTRSFCPPAPCAVLGAHAAVPSLSAPTQA